MSTDVLSTLCSICHVEPPKYKCPRCLARTCSAACIQKHKTRADCDGQRNPRAFVPITQLKTAAGIDHDFNFISSIERARERAEKEIIEARHLLSEKEIHHDRAKEDKVFQKVWRGDQLEHIPVSRPRQNDHMDVVGFDKSVRRRLRQLDLEVINMPKGMSRPKQNFTSFNRRTMTINWQVEWLVYDSQQGKQPLQILHKCLEGTSLFQGLSAAIGFHQARLDKSENPQQSRKSLKRKRGLPSSEPAAIQDFTSSSWTGTPLIFTAQSPLLSDWSNTTNLPAYQPSQEEIISKYQFFLSKPRTKHLIPLRSTEDLAEALRGRTVIEFPTILAIVPGEEVPPKGYEVLSGEERRIREEEDGEDSEEEGEVEERSGARPHNLKRTYNKRGGRGGRGRGRGGNYRDDGRAGKKVRFERAPKEEVVISEDEGEVVEDVNVDVDVDVDADADVEKIQQVVEMDLGVMMGTASGTRQDANGARLLVDYGSDSD
ncbi:Box C/D snoRNA protein 1 [Podospora fimiseda]|uniref:Box C/D snoRNA protein 1 n=1 Tax=Podospora fimiseda TaxID=252190 RepID=A0AAN7BQE5_9PEZI|nr:Box C/D snoRNA protein 1 [Podospora fimiseda]